MLDLRRLQVLHAVGKYGSLSAAARALNYTQPAISHQIRRLEAEVGTPLLYRSRGLVRLNEAGKYLAERGEDLINQLGVVENHVAAIAGLRSGTVRIASFPSGSATLIPLAVQTLKASLPEVSVSSTDAEPPEAISSLHSGGCDIALAFDYEETSIVRTLEFERVELMRDELDAVLPSSHALAGRDAVEISELRDEKWIAGCDRCRAHLLHTCAEVGFVPNVQSSTDDYVAAQTLVAAGVGVAILPRLALVAFRHASVVTMPLRHGQSRTIVALVPAPQHRPPAVTAVLDALVTASAELTTAE